MLSRSGGDQNRGCVLQSRCSVILSFQLAAVMGRCSSPVRTLPMHRKPTSVRITEANRPQVRSQPIQNAGNSTEKNDPNVPTNNIEKRAS